MISSAIRIADTARINNARIWRCWVAQRKPKGTGESLKREQTGYITCKIRRVKCDGIVTPALRLKELILTKPTSTELCANVLHRKKTNVSKMSEVWNEV